MKPKDVTYIGIHNRRTDFHKHLLETIRKKKEKKQDYKELGKDYFMDGMEYFRLFQIYLLLMTFKYLPLEIILVKFI